MTNRIKHLLDEIRDKEELKGIEERVSDFGWIRDQMAKVVMRAGLPDPRDPNRRELIEARWKEMTSNERAKALACLVFASRMISVIGMALIGPVEFALATARMEQIIIQFMENRENGGD